MSLYYLQDEVQTQQPGIGTWTWSMPSVPASPLVTPLTTPTPTSTLRSSQKTFCSGKQPAVSVPLNLCMPGFSSPGMPSLCCKMQHKHVLLPQSPPAKLMNCFHVTDKKNLAYHCPVTHFTMHHNVCSPCLLFFNTPRYTHIQHVKNAWVSKLQKCNHFMD